MNKKTLKSKTKIKLGYEKKRELSSFLFTIPLLIGFFMFFLYPLIRTFQLSFLDQDVSTNVFKSVGFSNYKTLFSGFIAKVDGKDFPFTRVVWESVQMVLIELPFIIIFSLLIAVILNQKFKGRGIARTIFLLPIIFGSGIIAQLTSTNPSEAYYQKVITAQKSYGVLNLSYLLESALIPSNITLGLGNFVSRVFTIISFSGVQILIFLSALQSINPTLYEVAKIEGATKYDAFWKITLPQIMPITITTVVYTFVEILYRSPMTQIIELTVRKQTSHGGIGIASAIAVIFLIITMALLAVIIFVLKGLENHGKKEKIKRKKY